MMSPFNYYLLAEAVLGEKRKRTIMTKRSFQLHKFQAALSAIGIWTQKKFAVGCVMTGNSTRNLQRVEADVVKSEAETIKGKCNLNLITFDLPLRLCTA